MGSPADKQLFSMPVTELICLVRERIVSSSLLYTMDKC